MIHPRHATSNVRTAAEYGLKPLQGNDTERYCAVADCNTRLSRYNRNDTICGPCRAYERKYGPREVPE